MGCCENKTAQSDIVLFTDKHVEIKQQSFDEMSLYTEGNEINDYIFSSPQAGTSFSNTFNGIELAFLIGNMIIHSKTQSLLISPEEVK